MLITIENTTPFLYVVADNLYYFFFHFDGNRLFVTELMFYTGKHNKGIIQYSATEYLRL